MSNKMKKEELIKQNEKLILDNQELRKELNDVKPFNEAIKLDHKRYIVDIIINILLLITIIGIFCDTIFTAIDNKKTRDMINNAEACIEINDDIYCKLEVKND